MTRSRTSNHPYLFIALVLGFAAAMVAPTGLWATTCPTGGCSYGPCVYTDLIVDGAFEDFPCSNGWTFVGYTSRLYDQGTCSSSSGYLGGYHAVFYGVDGGQATGSVFQDIDIPSDGGTIGPDELSFYVDIQGASASTWDRLYVRLRDPSTGQLLETVKAITGSSGWDCRIVSAQVSGDYRGQTVRLSFESVIWDDASTRFVVDTVSYYHYD